MFGQILRNSVECWIAFFIFRTIIIKNTRYCCTNLKKYNMKRVIFVISLFAVLLCSCATVQVATFNSEGQVPMYMT